MHSVGDARLHSHLQHRQASGALGRRRHGHGDVAATDRRQHVPSIVRPMRNAATAARSAFEPTKRSCAEQGVRQDGGRTDSDQLRPPGTRGAEAIPIRHTSDG